MFIGRNNNCNTGKGCNWLLILTILMVLGVVIFGARHKLKQELREFAAIDKMEIEEIVANYIKEHPKAIINSLQEMQKKEFEENMKQAKQSSQEINPFIGNKDGDVVITAFLDYRCGYCKKNNNDLKALVKNDSKVKITFKELPVLGPQSLHLAKMALSVYLIDNNKYADFHNALMENEELNDKALSAILAKQNISFDKVTEMMKDPRIDQELKDIRVLAEKLGVNGTPAYVIGEGMIPGALNLEVLTKIVKEVREKK